MNAGSMEHVLLARGAQLTEHDRVPYVWCVEKTTLAYAFWTILSTRLTLCFSE